MADKKTWKIMINNKPKDWPKNTITGREIKEAAGSPKDWVVNEIIAGPGEDPEIGDDQIVDLDTPGREKFITRKPKTSPGT